MAGSPHQARADAGWVVNAAATAARVSGTSTRRPAPRTNTIPPAISTDTKAISSLRPAGDWRKACHDADAKTEPLLGLSRQRKSPSCVPAPAAAAASGMPGTIPETEGAANPAARHTHVAFTSRPAAIARLARKRKRAAAMSQSAGSAAAWVAAGMFAVVPTAKAKLPALK